MTSRLVGKRCDYGPVFWIRFAEWCAARQRILSNVSQLEAMQLVKDTFCVSRATAYRWLKAWREVHPTIEGSTS